MFLIIRIETDPRSETEEYINKMLIQKQSITNYIISANKGYDPRQNTKILQTLLEKWLQWETSSEPSDSPIKIPCFPKSSRPKFESQLDASLNEFKNEIWEKVSAESLKHFPGNLKINWQINCIEQPYVANNDS